jgi:hypothetical protein
MIEEPEQFKKIENYSELSDNQKKYFYVIMDAMITPGKTYFARGLDKNQKPISNNDLVKTWTELVTKRKEVEPVNAFILSLFQTCYTKLGVLFLKQVSFLKEKEIITWDYVDRGLSEQVELQDFYQILNNLNQAKPIIRFIIETLQEKGIEDAFPIVDCFVTDVLLKAPLNPEIFPEKQPEEGLTKTYKSLYEDFLKNKIPFSSEAERLSNQPLIEMVTLSAIKALCIKLMISFDQNDVGKQNSLKEELKAIYEETILSPYMDIQVVESLNFFLRQAKKSFEKGAFEKSIQDIFDMVEQKKQEQGAREHIIREGEQQQVGQPQVEVLRKSFPYKTIFVASILLLGIGGIMRYIRSNPRLFAQYPVLQKIVPFLMPAVELKTQKTFLQKLADKVRKYGFFNNH